MLRKIYHFFKDVYYKFIVIYKILGSNKKQVFWLLNTPDHGNIGDQAIVQAEIAFFHHYFKKYRLVELTARQWFLSKEYIVSHVKTQDMVFIHGGGYIGDLWPGAEKMAREIITCLKNNKIIMLQNTIFYYDQKHESSLEFYNRENLYLFLRDRMSYDIARKYVDGDKCYLLPDTVLFLNYRKNREIRNKRILFCLRTDKEQIEHGHILDEIHTFANNENFTVTKTDMIHTHDAVIGMRKYLVMKKIKEFQQASLVVTDRLHGMYFAAITGTPCVIMDNVSGKVSGGYKEWLKKCDFLYFVTDNKFDISKVKKIIKNKNNMNSDVEIKKYFEYEVQIIRDVLEMYFIH